MPISYIIEGGDNLRGEVTVGGSQQQAAIALISALVTEESVVVRGVPNTQWIQGLIECLQFVGVSVSRKDSEVTVNAKDITTTALPANLVSKTPFSILLLGGLLSRTERVSLEVPQDNYPYDSFQFHRAVFSQGLEGDIREQDGYISIYGHISNSDIVLDYPSPRVSVQALLAVVSSPKQVTIKNVSAHPDVEFAIRTLQERGVEITEHKKGEYIVNSKGDLHGGEVMIRGDIDETVFWAVCAVHTRGELTIENVSSSDITPFLSKLTQIGVQFKLEKNSLTLWCEDIKELSPISIDIKPYPGIIPEWAGWLLILFNRINGTSTLIQTSRLDKMTYLSALKLLSMEIGVNNFEETKDGNVYPHEIKVFGGASLAGAEVKTTTLRDGLVVLLAALGAQGTTTIQSEILLENGFENLFDKLEKVGARLNAI